jgi:hypothetical protein
MSFSTYWKKQEQKKRKSWASKAKRYAEQHTGLEDIRNEVYMPLDYRPAIEFASYKKAHFTRSKDGYKTAFYYLKLKPVGL